MKKGQIRTGIVEEVRFPNRAMVRLEPLEGEETVLETAEYCEVKGRKFVKKGQIRTGIVEEVRFPNRAMVRLEPLEGEETVLETAEYCEVKGALPGQRVSFAVTKVRKGKGEGRLKEILSKAPEETMVLETAEYCEVKGALPGQRVSFAVTKVRKGKGEGRLKEILSKAPEETMNEENGGCRYFGSCGGCSYMSMPYEESLKIKEQQVHRLLEPVLAKQENVCKIEPIKASPVCYGYRNKMEFTFGDEVKNGPLALGMHKKGSFYDIVTVDGCRIVDEDYSRILTATLTYFEKKNTPFYHRFTHEGYLRHLLVRRASYTGEILVALVTTGQEGPELAAWKEELLALPLNGKIAGILHIVNDSLADAIKSDRMEILYGQDFFYEELLGEELLALPLNGKIAGILHIVNDSLADAIKSDRMEILYGQDFFYEELLGLKFRISTFSFFQTNTKGAEVLYETAREYVDRMEILYGQDFFYEELLGLKFRISTFSFFQTNTKGAEVLYETAREYVGSLCEGEEEPSSIVYDLYSGTGTIAQLMAPVAKKVIGVEIVEEAVEAARKSVRRRRRAFQHRI